MTRFLFVVPPLVGHVNPAVGVAAELTARGHDVAWAGVPEVVHGLTGPDAQVFACAVPQGVDGDVVARPAGLRGAAALKFLWEQFLVPLGAAMVPGVVDAVTAFGPDVLVVDQQAFAGAVVAERLGLPWVTSATTSAELMGAYDGMPLVEAWVTGLFQDLRRRTGDAEDGVDPRFSPHLILAFTTTDLAGHADSPGGPVCFVGPSIDARPSTTDFPWGWCDPSRRLVLASLGTANADAGTGFLTACREALRSRSDRLQGVLVDPGGLLGGPSLDPDLIVATHVPQVELLADCSAVICHAGHNTVCEALWHGVPLVVAPIRDDQPVVAGQVVSAGAGVRVRFGRTDAVRLGAALDAVLDVPSHREAAVRISRSFRAAGGASTAADHLDALLVRR